jgi:hypothetical protein
VNDEQANDIIESVMKAHWPKWEFKGQELKVWLEELRKFEYEIAKYAINELYKVWQSNRYPKMPIVMGNIRKLAIAKSRAEKKLVRLFTITRQDGRPRWFPFTGYNNISQEEIEKRAEQLRAEANRLWPDEEEHIVCYHSLEAEEPDEQESQEEQEEIPF